VLRAYTSGDVTISGTVTGDAGSALVVGAADTQYSRPTSANAADMPLFEVGTLSWDLRGGAWTPDTIRVTGVIGGPANTAGDVLGAGSSWLGLVSLAAQTVLIFPPNDDALLSVGGFEQAVGGTNGQDPATLFSYRGQLRQQIVADTFAVRASDAILQRNLDPTVPSSEGRGLVVGRLVVDTLTPDGAIPTRMSLFGQLATDLNGLRDGVTLVDGAAASTLVRDATFGGSASVRFNAPPGTYRFNGCEIGTGGGCLTVRVDPSLPPIDAISAIGNLLDRFATIEDEPVTSTGVELFWFARDDDEDEDEDDEEEEKK
jgi:hypothetical protein